jgi:hypothetical protein
MKPSLFNRFLSWFDHYGLVALTGFLIAFIPLYPKIPFFSPIEQYNVRVRIEDFLVLLTALVWFAQWLKGKVTTHPVVTWVIGSYIVVGLLSVLSGIFVTQTVPSQPLYIGKTVLHYFRYIEYFSLFFIAFSAIKTKQHIKYLLAIFAATVLAAAIYGYGQRHFYWPVYSTMNREFSKGMVLYLTEHARVQSTFAGHYDLGAYLVIILPLLLALAYEAKDIRYKGALHFIHWAGLWLLVVSASRTSFVAYFAGVAIVLVLMGIRQIGWWEKIRWMVGRGFVMGLIIAITMLTWGEDMYDRLIQVIEGYPKFYQTYNHYNDQRKQISSQFVPALLGKTEWPSFKVTPPENGISTDEAARILVKSDERPVRTKPSDVYVDVPDLVEVEVATISASGSATTTTVIEERDRVFSECAKQRGLSLCIRLETLWPQAIAGFKRNPFLGSGYATLNIVNVRKFEEADSTDNNFLRTLGETGILGFITFYGVILVALFYASRAYLSKDTLLQTLALSYIAGTVGLLINAVYIDVFASSKVAFTYWLLTGLLLAYSAMHHNQTQSERPVVVTTKKPAKNRKSNSTTKSAKRKKSH